MAAVAESYDSVRSPSSLLASEATKAVSEVVEDRVVADFNLGCLSDKALVKKNVKAKHIRLIGKKCKFKEEIDQLSIFNRSNGLRATVFDLKNGRFSSDYFKLKAGRNQIIISFKRGKEEFVAAHIDIHQM